MDQNSEQNNGNKQAKVLENVNKQQGEQPIVKKNILEDPESPFLYSHQDVRLLLKSCSQNGWPNYDKLNFDLLKFKVKKTESNFCSHYIKANQEQYFECENCRYNISMIYCKGCFDPQKHVGHIFSKKIPQHDQAYCDCGRVQRLKQSSFCKGHSNFDKVIQCEIPEQERKHFLNIMKNLLDCAIYQYYIGHQSTVLLTKIFPFLHNLNESSVYYNRLTMEFLSSMSQYWLKMDDAQRPQINQYFLFMSGYSDCEGMSKLVIHLCGDLQTRKAIIILLCMVMGVIQQNVSIYLGRLNCDEIFNHTVIHYLSSSGISNKLIQYFFKRNLPSPSPQSKQVYKRHFENKVKLADNLAQILQLIETDLTDFPKSTKKAVLFKLLQLYPDSVLIQSMISDKLKEKKAKVQNILYLANEYPNGLRGMNDMIFRMIYDSDITTDIQTLKNFRKYLFDNGVSQQQLQQFIKWATPQLCNSVYFIDKESPTNYYIVYLLAMINGSPNQEKTMSDIWDILLTTHNPQVFDKGRDKRKKLTFTELHLFADTFQFIVNNVLRIDSFSLVAKKISIWPQKDTIIDQKMDVWFKSYLYEKKVITKQQLIGLKKNHLTTDNSSKILNQLCIYVEQYSSFLYTSKEKYPNLIHQFSGVPRKCKFQDIYECGIRFGDKFILQEGSFSSILIPMIMKHKTFVDFYDKQWLRYLNSQFAGDNRCSYGYLYLFSLVLYDILTDGRNKQLRDRLTIIANDEKTLLQFTNKKQQFKLLRRLFNFDKKNNQQEKQKEDKVEKIQNNDVNAQDKSQNVKQQTQICQKTENKQKPQQKQKQLVNVCIHCKKQQTTENPLAYIGVINKNHTVCSMLFGDNNVTRTFIQTCLHKIHINCFINLKLKQKSKRFPCPKCSRHSNCIIPIEYERQNYSYNSACYNSMIHSSVQSAYVYDIQSLFTVLFKHFVEALGLRTFIETSKKQRQKKQQMGQSDRFLFQLMGTIYQQSQQEQRNKYLIEIDQLITQINQKAQKPYSLIQLLFINALKTLMLTNNAQVDYKIYDQLKTCLIPQEREVVKIQLATLTPYKIKSQTESEGQGQVEGQGDQQRKDNNKINQKQKLKQKQKQKQKNQTGQILNKDQNQTTTEKQTIEGIQNSKNDQIQEDKKNQIQKQAIQTQQVIQEGQIQQEKQKMSEYQIQKQKRKKKILQTKKKQQKQKISQIQPIYTQFPRLPKNPAQLFQIFRNLGCLCPNTFGTGICLFCGIGLCQNCIQRHNVAKHNNLLFCFSSTNFMISTYLTTSSNRWDVYQSQFKISINQGAKDKDSFNPAEYSLNSEKYQTILDFYLEN